MCWVFLFFFSISVWKNMFKTNFKHPSTNDNIFFLQKYNQRKGWTRTSVLKRWNYLFSLKMDVVLRFLAGPSWWIGIHHSIEALLCFWNTVGGYFYIFSYSYGFLFVRYQDHREECEFVDVVCKRGCGTSLLKYQLESHICIDPSIPSLQEELALCNTGFMEDGEYTDVSTTSLKLCSHLGRMARVKIYLF